ncbi:MAG TPA: hypothetical protein PKH55_08880, partial [Bacteroidales bacterium]|nr:hypothetical protein [Bacteroidales bacterium]
PAPKTAAFLILNDIILLLLFPYEPPFWFTAHKFVWGQAAHPYSPAYRVQYFKDRLRPAHMSPF